ncbi:hypothetical protein ACS5PU_16630 [Pedobacter sp. GSP4]|uniref:hypothetical protein n=1 Tax=Pedobacter sp. GSP4 TaxID=3453716 RepID=UPI003EEFA935
MQNLTGSLVLVNPELTSDPVSRQGHVGVIVGADLKSDSIAVGFGTSKLGVYSSDALMVLKDHSKLWEIAMNNHKQMEPDTYKSLLVMSMDLYSGDLKRMANAIEMAKGSPELMEYSLISLEEKLTMDISIADTKRDPTIYNSFYFDR